ncbi:TetR family transcriptional regulator [Zhihengliuella halotolerans]|uniref:TetR family transcriptional regulator n=2 Tax=Zhihengliuella halotolerans TaxID=370736 RepID=A0A4Q8A992_9MICC|nr:TetR family transcriptional regulator [Zhihengliuella halotolerans]
MREGYSLRMDETPLPMHARRRELGEASRQHILDVAVRLMSERGFEGTAMSALCKETGLPASSIYWHFGSKDGLLEAVMERGGEQFFTSFPDPGDAAEPADKLRRFVRSTGAWLLEESRNGQFLQLQLRFRLSRRAPLAEKFAAKADAGMQKSIEYVRAWIAYAYASEGEEVAQRLAAETAHFAVAMLDGVFIMVYDDDRVDAVEMIDDAAEALVSRVESRLAAIKPAATE